jgi:hypothetical protein
MHSIFFDLLAFFIWMALTVGWLFNDIGFQKLSCSKILKVLGRWSGRNPFSKGFLPRRLLLSCNYLPGNL